MLWGRDINNLGQIVGTGEYEGQDRAFRLTPLDGATTPEPTTLALVLLGATAAIVRRRR